MNHVVSGDFGEWAKDGSPNYDGNGECGVLVKGMGGLRCGT